MAAPRRVVELGIGPDELAQLETIARSRTDAASRVERARILLVYRAEPSSTAVGAQCGVTHHTVQRCLRRAMQFGVMAALDDSRNKATRVSLRNLDPSLLMWDMRRNLDPTPMPARRSTIQFLYPELQPSQQNWWLVVEPDVGTDLCSADPGFEVDLYVETNLRTMTAIWMGLATVEQEVRAGRMQLTGDSGLRHHKQRWLGLSVFAKERKLAA